MANAAAAMWCLVVLAIVALVAAEADPGHHGVIGSRHYYKRPYHYNQRRPQGTAHLSHSSHSVAIGGHSTLGHASVGHLGGEHDTHSTLGHASVGHLGGKHDTHSTLGHASVGHLGGKHDTHSTLGHASVGHLGGKYDTHSTLGHASVGHLSGKHDIHSTLGHASVGHSASHFKGTTHGVHGSHSKRYHH